MPIYFLTHESLGRMYLERSSKEKALEEFLNAIELEPWVVELYLR